MIALDVEVVVAVQHAPRTSAQAWCAQMTAFPSSVELRLQE